MSHVRHLQHSKAILCHVNSTEVDRLIRAGYRRDNVAEQIGFDRF
jgi:hypothetical protein